MLKKLIRHLSKNKLFANKINDPEDVDLTLASEKKVLDTAEELKSAGDQSLRANNQVQAELYYRQSLEINPNQPVAYNHRGIALYCLGRLDEALASYDHAIALKPDYAAAHNNRGLVLDGLKRPDEALASYDHAIALKPDYAEAYYNRGIVLDGLKRTDEALTSYERAIALKPDYAEAYYNRGIVLDGLKRLDEALASYDRAIALKPDYAAAYNNRGLVLDGLKRPDESLASYDRAIALKPDDATAYNNRGLVLDGLKRPDDALASYDHAIALKPDYAAAYNNRGLVLDGLKRPDEALASYDRAIALKPDYAEAYYNRGIVLDDLKRPDEALASYDRAIVPNPDYAEAYYNRGLVLDGLKRTDEALASYNRAIALKPHNAEAYNNLGLVLDGLKRTDEALTSYERAIALQPDNTAAYNNRGVVLGGLKRSDEALASYDRAIALKPDYAEAYYNRGIVLDGLKRTDEALASYDRAIALKPDYAEAYYNRGIVLNDLKRLGEALTSYGHALALKPGHEFLYGHWLNTKMMLCDWSNYDNEIMQLTDKIEREEKASPPFVALSQSSSRALQKKAAEIHVRSKYPIDYALPKITKHPRHGKIRIGYFSADFRNHPVSFLTAELFEMHDRSKFELTAFSFGPDTKDEMRSRIEAAFDRFIDVREYSDQEVALMARKLEIDIAIDLGGFTAGCRTGIFALRTAPFQVSYLGYLGTMGAEYIDYLIADTSIIPQAHQKDYTEKIVYLPSYQVNDTKRSIADKVFTRKELGLPPTGFVFCCFNNSYKITPSIFDSWMRILQQVEGSILWLLEDNATVATNLIKEAALRGIDRQRLIFAKRLPLPEYLARYRIADLFLDTSPYNAGTTASDALWAGLPVLTCLGETFAGRVAASLLNAIRLPELITTTQEEYVALAVLLATQPDKLMNIKQRLADNRLTTPLFDTQQFTQNIEAAYTQMYQRYHADLMLDHIDVKANNH